MNRRELFPQVAPEAAAALDRYFDILAKVFPLSPGHRRELPRDIRDLWHGLTDERSGRLQGYMGRPATLSAYLHYFLPWNLYRYVRFLAGTEITVPEGGTMVDIGSGPLAVPIALFIAAPELRNRRITVRCLDRSGSALETGAALLRALALELSGKELAWRLDLVPGDAGGKGGPAADLVTAANVLNELFWADGRPAAEQAARNADWLSGLCRPGGTVVVLEAGIPRSGEHVTLLRREFIGRGFSVAAPCTHAGPCPFPGSRHGLGLAAGDGIALPRNPKVPWCHFNLEIGGAPARLLGISEEAGLAKEGVSLTVLAVTRPVAGAARGPDAAGAAAGPAEATSGTGGRAAARHPAAGITLPVRVISEGFRLPYGFEGRYCCSARGYSLVRYRGPVAGGTGIGPGTLLDGDFGRHPDFDEKSGAAVCIPAGTAVSGSSGGGSDGAPHRGSRPRAADTGHPAPGSARPDTASPYRPGTGTVAGSGNPPGEEGRKPPKRGRWRDAPAWVPRPGRHRDGPGKR